MFPHNARTETNAVEKTRKMWPNKARTETNAEEIHGKCGQTRPKITVIRQELHSSRKALPQDNTRSNRPEQAQTALRDYAP